VAVGNDSARQDSLAAAANPLATTSPSFNFEDYMSDLKEHIRDIADFPKPGIMFRDITPLLANPDAFREVIRLLADKYRDAGVTAICAAEARGFIFATPLALELNAAFVPIRKPGKLPFDTKAFHYELEYGTDTLEMHTDAVKAGDKVLLVDDLLATGGTMEACVKLCKHTGAEVVGCAFVIELTFIGGREKLAPTDCFSLISYDSED
jgi:adenine phosphoribosyltransferase